MLSADGRTLTAPGPPMLNCEKQVLKEGTFRLSEHGSTMSPRHVQHVNGSTTRWDVPANTSADLLKELWITVNGITARVPIQPSGSAAFSDKRVIYTMSQNNQPQWIRDWAMFHARTHGANAMIIYDNSSTLYTLKELSAALQGIEGIESLEVVPWNYSFGTGTGPKGEYDSNYSQMGAITHARWRFAESAQACLFTDIDELVISMDGSSLFDRLLESGAPCLTFIGRWVTAVRPTWQSRPPETTDGGKFLHTDCVYQTRQGRYLTKWVAAPDRCDEQSQWLLHCVTGLPEPHDAAASYTVPTTLDFEMRHCNQISTNWKYSRTYPQRYLPFKHRYDWRFARTLARAFPDRSIHRVLSHSLFKT